MTSRTMNKQIPLISHKEDESGKTLKKKKKAENKVL